MKKNLFNRLWHLILIILGVSFISFLLISLTPGDYLTNLSLNPEIPPQTIEKLRHDFGLDKPFYIQYFKWIYNVSPIGFNYKRIFPFYIKSPNLGYSFSYKINVSTLIFPCFLNTILLGPSCSLWKTEVYISAEGNIFFKVGDILDLKNYTKQFDTVLTTRVLINLGNWDNQKKALNECVLALKTQGRLLLSEATVQGWENLNRFRQEWGLSIIPEPPFNVYVDEDKIIDFLTKNYDMEFMQLINFSSTYYVATRIIKPLLAKALEGNIHIDVANPQMHWNKWASHLPAWGNYGTQKLFVFQKK